MVEYALLRAALFSMRRPLAVDDYRHDRQHTILTPDPSSRHTPSSNDTALLLADLVRAVRLGDRAWLLEPFASPSVCSACAAAYSAAWDVVGGAGGVTAWVAQFETRWTNGSHQTNETADAAQ